jgi:hypothetical protein
VIQETLANHDPVAWCPEADRQEISTRTKAALAEIGRELINGIPKAMQV